jgi:hypothetical protein
MDKTLVKSLYLSFDNIEESLDLIVDNIHDANTVLALVNAISAHNSVSRSTIALQEALYDESISSNELSTIVKIRGEILDNATNAVLNVNKILREPETPMIIN